MPGTTRRQLLASTACALAIGNLSRAVARTYSGALPWEPFDGSPRAMERPGPWQFFTHDEAAAIEAIVDRLIPRDERRAHGIWPGYLSGCLFGLSHRTGPRRQSSLSKACPQPGRPVRQRDYPHS